MSSPWPAPEQDVRDSGRRPAHPTTGAGRDHVRPNYALRRLVAVVALLAVIGGVVAVVLLRRSDDARSDRGRSPWDVVVTQDATTHAITVIARDGSTLSTTPTQLIGLSDVGLPGRVLVGTAGHTSRTGAALLDLADGVLTPLTLSTDLLAGAEGSPFRIGYDATTKAVEVLDARRGHVLDLLQFTTAPTPVVLPDSVRFDDAGTHLAFTELTRSETIVVSLDTGEAISVPGLLADLAFDTVMTMTNRGATALLDRYDLGGTRTATVELALPIATMLTSADAAVAVAADGTTWTVDFPGAAAHQKDQVAPSANTGDSASSSTTSPTSSGAGTATTSPPTVAEVRLDGGSPALDRQRLLVVGEDVQAVVDDTGSVVSRRTATGTTAVLAAEPDDRCVLVTEASGGTVDLVDVDTGTVIATNTAAVLTGRSGDGCVVAFQTAGATGSTLVDNHGQRSVTGSVRAVSLDGTAALQTSTEGVLRYDLTGGVDDERLNDPVHVTTSRATAVFATR